MNSKSKNEIAYDQWSESYDSGLNSTITVDDFSFPELWKNLKNQRVLEIGVGTGRHTERLLKLGNFVVGVDLSDGMLDKLRLRLSSEKLVLIHGDILHIDPDRILSGQYFDAALCSLVLEHIEDLEFFFQKIARLLNVGAKFYISEIHPDRAKQGRLAHFKDLSTDEEIWCDSRFHSAEHIENSAIKFGFACLKSLDFLGGDNLLLKNINWEKYIGKPMVKGWEFQLVRKTL